MTTDEPMPLVAHLRELRDRFRNALIAVFVAFLGLFPFANELYTYVSEPLRLLLPEGSSMIATEVTSPFLTPFKLSLVLAVFVAMPVILAQLWGFIAPGLYKSEKRIAIPLLTSSVILFYAGVAFAYYVVFPLLFGFFTTVGPVDISVMTDITRSLDYVLKLFFAFGEHRVCSAWGDRAGPDRPIDVLQFIGVSTSPINNHAADATVLGKSAHETPTDRSL